MFCGCACESYCPSEARHLSATVPSAGGSQQQQKHQPSPPSQAVSPTPSVQLHADMWFVTASPRLPANGGIGRREFMFSSRESAFDVANMDAAMPTAKSMTVERVTVAM